jgi:hypothetical protein
MLWPFDPAREIRRDNADCRQNRLAGLGGPSPSLDRRQRSSNRAISCSRPTNGVRGSIVPLRPGWFLRVSGRLGAGKLHEPFELCEILTRGARVNPGEPTFSPVT